MAMAYSRTAQIPRPDDPNFQLHVDELIRSLSGTVCAQLSAMASETGSEHDYTNEVTVEVQVEPHTNIEDRLRYVNVTGYLEREPVGYASELNGLDPVLLSQVADDDEPDVLL